MKIKFCLLIFTCVLSYINSVRLKSSSRFLVNDFNFVQFAESINAPCN